MKELSSEILHPMTEPFERIEETSKATNNENKVYTEK